MTKEELWELIEAYRMSGGRVEHHARKELLDQELTDLFNTIVEQKALNITLVKANALSEQWARQEISKFKSQMIGVLNKW